MAKEKKNITGIKSEVVETVFVATLALLKKFEVSATPENYTLFYDYVTGENDTIRSAFDKIIKQNGIFSEEELSSIYSSVMKAKENFELEKLGNELQTVVKSVFKQVTKLQGTTGESSDKIALSINNLSENSGYNEIFEAVNIIRTEADTLSCMSNRISEELESSNRELGLVQEQLDCAVKETRIDHLTGIANRLGLDEKLEEMLEHGKFSILMIDIDHFKMFNDRFGHLTGDKVLRFVAKSISNQVKGSDFPARFGGEEFVVLLPETTMNGAAVVAENIRKFFNSAHLKGHTSSQDLGKVTVSIGVTECRGSEELYELLERVDGALYKAKHSGRNRVENG
jgi:diguanylate cyclase